VFGFRVTKIYKSKIIKIFMRNSFKKLERIIFASRQGEKVLRHDLYISENGKKPKLYGDQLSLLSEHAEKRALIALSEGRAFATFDDFEKYYSGDVLVKNLGIN